MPDDTRPVVGIGIGPSLSFDWRLFDPFTVGASAGMTLFDGAGFNFNSSSFGVVRYDLRGMYLLRDGGATNVTISAVAGVWGDTSFLRQPVEGIPFGLEGGIALSYPFLPQLIARINFVAGYQFFSSPLGVNPGYFPPASGLELAYYPLPNLELTVGYNGQGDILGLRWHI
ncbi:MAG: hypothetical protein H7338_07890 [Candidatus Sericytochromatia bacterium]|nr:hypothetical protein [Candidatus Sericytochromatia bacterium]